MSTSSQTAAPASPPPSDGDLAEAVARRRNFAIISHPDAGKTTLTEKLLLYGGAIQQAGAVKAKGEQRKVTSDWMELDVLRLCDDQLRCTALHRYFPGAGRHW